MEPRIKQKPGAQTSAVGPAPHHGSSGLLVCWVRYPTVMEGAGGNRRSPSVGEEMGAYFSE